MTATLPADTRTPARQTVRRTNSAHRGRKLLHLNWLGGTAGWVWLGVVLVPLYWILVTSLKLQADYYGANPLALPSDPTLENYRFVWEAGFARYFLNSVIVTLGAVVPAVLVAVMAAFAIVRGGAGRFLRAVNGLFLAGLAIPLQATIIP